MQNVSRQIWQRERLRSTVWALLMNQTNPMKPPEAGAPIRNQEPAHSDIRNERSQMGKFRKKPVVIEAVQFDGTSAGCDKVQRFVGRTCGLVSIGANWNVLIHTLEGDMLANSGDWIIKGVKGEFYPCKPDIFEATYEAAE